ncbi:CLIP domain-containing serine protease 2-like [Bradysia coprophila]|uniref:CLIP domain-containing serine protease 2-like n=1 Tax=Bradysia coprophila TaxID=38358 RepID=UPI00187DC43A|nr:CLIP domain-containing serine protease 2-like [Bradysia coprophila]
MISTTVRVAVMLALLSISAMQSAAHECGIQNFSDKIINGNVTAIDEYPWTVLIRYKQPNSNRETWGCGGSLVGTKTILTAAHCVEDMALASLGRIEFVRLGEYDYSTEMDCVVLSNYKDCTDPPVDIKVTNVIIHPERNANSKLHDIAILTLETTPKHTDFIRPICLPDQTLDDPSKKKSVYYVTGWGNTIGSLPSPSSVKMDTAVNPVDGSECRKNFPDINEKFQLCAGGKAGHNVCRGDSGGPLMYTKDNKWTIEGVVSYGRQHCGRVGFDSEPAVFTRIAGYLPWIKNVLLDQERPSWDA